MIIVLTMFPIYRSTNKTKEQTDQLNLLNNIKTVLVKFSPYDVSWPKHSPNLKFEACSIITLTLLGSELNAKTFFTFPKFTPKTILGRQNR